MFPSEDEADLLRSEAPFTARLTARTSGGPLLLYDWIEQSFNPDTGALADAIDGRSGEDGTAPACERNNLFVDVPSYVQLQLRGVVGDLPYYEFDASTASFMAAYSTATVSTSLNDYPLTAATTYLNVTADIDITGFVTITGGPILIVNVGTGTMTVKNQSSSSSAANRVITVTGGDLWVRPGMAVSLLYDSSAGRYRVTCCSATSYDGTPADVTIGTSQNDYSLSNPAPVQRWNITGDLTITGIVPPPGGARRFTLTNTGTGLLTLAHESASSTAGNRIKTPTGAPLVLRPGTTAVLRHDPALARWIPDEGSAVLAPSAVYLPELASAPATPPTGSTALYVKGDGHLYGKDDAGAETDLTASSGVTGAGTNGYLVKWTGASTQGDSIVSADSSTVTFTQGNLSLHVGGGNQAVLATATFPGAAHGSWNVQTYAADGVTPEASLSYGYDGTTKRFKLSTGEKFAVGSSDGVTGTLGPGAASTGGIITSAGSGSYGDATTSGTLAQFAATTSAQLAGVISDETGSGKLAFATSPTLVTPLLGTPTSGTLTNCTGLPLSSGVTGTLAAGQFPALTGDVTTLAGGLTTTLATTIPHAETLKLTNATTNATDGVLTLSHASSGTPATNFGAGLRLKLASDSTADRDAFELNVYWTSAVDASRAARADVVLYADSHNLTAASFGAILSGTYKALIGFLGATPVAQQTGDAGTALVTFGLMSGTPTFAGANISGTGTIPAAAYPTMVAAGASHAKGAVGDPGATSHADHPYYWGDNAGFNVIKGYILDKKQVLTAQTTTSATATGLTTALSVSFTLDSTQDVVLRAWCNALSSVTDQTAKLYYDDGGGAVMMAEGTVQPANGAVVLAGCTLLAGLTTGSYTYTQKYSITGGATGTFRERYLEAVIA